MGGIVKKKKKGYEYQLKEKVRKKYVVFFHVEGEKLINGQEEEKQAAPKSCAVVRFYQAAAVTTSTQGLLGNVIHKCCPGSAHTV